MEFEEGGSLPPLDTLNGDSIDTFLVSLAQTIDWVASLLPLTDPATTLRNPTREPKATGYFNDGHHSVWLARLHRSRAKAPAADKVIPELQGGRLLVYFPDNSLWEGATGAASEGFIGDGDEPPWDTWVAYFLEPDDPRYLVAWIPSEAIDLVNRAAAVSSAPYFVWLEDFDSPVARFLHKLLYPPESTATFRYPGPRRSRR